MDGIFYPKLDSNVLLFGICLMAVLSWMWSELLVGGWMYMRGGYGVTNPLIRLDYSCAEGEQIKILLTF